MKDYAQVQQGEQTQRRPYERPTLRVQPLSAVVRANPGTVQDYWGEMARD